VSRVQEISKKFYRLADMDLVYKGFKQRLSKGLKREISTFGDYCDYYKKLGWKIQ